MRAIRPFSPRIAALGPFGPRVMQFDVVAPAASSHSLRVYSRKGSAQSLDYWQDRNEGGAYPGGGTGFSVGPPYLGRRERNRAAWSADGW